MHVNVKASGSELTLTVIDDGRGLGASARRSGLDNMLRRAEGLGGTFHVGTSPDAEASGRGQRRGRPGTRLVWRSRSRTDGAGPYPSCSLVAKTAACVRLSRPSFASMLDT